MRKLQLFVGTTLLACAGLANAIPESLPSGAKVACTQNSDGSGTLTVTGVNVTQVEIYHHDPSGATVRDRTNLPPASTYAVPKYATFNFLFKNAAGEDRYVLIDNGNDAVNAAKVFKVAGGTAAASPFNGVSVIPDARHGGIGGPGASMACTHMVRQKFATTAARD